MPSKINVKLDLKTLEELQQILDELRKFKKENEANRLSAERHLQQINIAEAQIEKGKEQREALIRKNNFLNESINEYKQKIVEASKFWEKFGLNIKQLGTDHYEFEYKIDVATSQNTFCVETKLIENIKIISHSPALFNSGDIVNLEMRLNKNTSVDWRLAVVIIRRALINKLTEK